MTLVDSLRQAIHSPAFKFIVVLFLILTLTIPLLFVWALVYERQRYAEAAAAEIGASWGGAQTLSGPYIIVPTERDQEVVRGSETAVQTLRSFAIFLPEILDVEGRMTTETRARGIFEVPVYRSQITFKGRFDPLDLKAVQANVSRLLWDEAAMILLVQDVRGIKATAQIVVGGNTRAFRAGSGPVLDQAPGIHVPVSEAEARSGFSFAFELPINGSTHLRLVPAGGETGVRLASDWPHPSFDGSFLPERRSVQPAGFEAEWQIPRLARGLGQIRQQAHIGDLATQMAFGVRLHQPVWFYSLAERALKYAVGFIAVAFFAVFVMEIQTARRVHWIQYVFVGLALVVFYVLLTGTSEHIGFDLGYAVAALATTALIASYFGMVVGSFARGAVLFGVLGTIYALLYLLLRLEDYALLVGSVAAFALIAIVMFATRGVDWSNAPINRPRAAASEDLRPPRQG
ncbi:MAG: cell envelope integrity protein CreD [Hyphomicrobiaceae bacterium]